jgi:hypothetical protein
LAGVVGVIVFFYLILISFAPASRLQNIGEDASAIQRYLLLKSTFNAGVKSYGFGLGLGQYQKLWRDFVDRDDPHLDFSTESLRSKLFDQSGSYKPYSTFGAFFAELGIFGLVGLVLIFLIILKNIFVLKSTFLHRVRLLTVLSVIFFAFIGAFPISMPNMWFVLALLMLESKKFS